MSNAPVSHLGPRSPVSVVYVLSSTERDYYAEMAAASAWMVRNLHPSARITLLLDEETGKSFETRKPQILELCDQRMVVPTGLNTPRERAWCIKSLIREAVPGDFLFLDTDALPVRSFDELFDLPCDFAAVLDRHDPPSRYEYPPSEKKLYAALNWRFPKCYYNSGVVLFRDTPAAHALGKEWAKRWREAWKAGEIADQYSLNSSLADLNVNVSTLPARYNAQIMMKRSAVRGASIIHIFSVAVTATSDTVLGRVVHRTKETGKLDTDALRRMQETGYPWADANWISGQLATGHYGRAIAAACRKLVGTKRGGNHE